MIFRVLLIGIPVLFCVAVYQLWSVYGSEEKPKIEKVEKVAEVKKDRAPAPVPTPTPTPPQWVVVDGYVEASGIMFEGRAVRLGEDFIWQEKLCTLLQVNGSPERVIVFYDGDTLRTQRFYVSPPVFEPRGGDIDKPALRDVSTDLSTQIPLLGKK